MLSRAIIAARRTPILVNDLGKQSFHMTSLMESSVAKGEIYQKQPAKYLLEKGKNYKWCACGLSGNQPFCDGNHKNSKKGVKGPIDFTPDSTKEYFLCNCKQTNQRPFCDGTHKTQ